MSQDPMDVCKNKKLNNCAHQATRYLEGLGFKFKNKSGVALCTTCKFPIRAKQVRNWAQNYKKVNQYSDQGIYLVYQQRDVDGQGHVYVIDDGSFEGNGLYNWPDVTQSGKISTTYYKIK